MIDYILFYLLFRKGFNVLTVKKNVKLFIMFSKKPINSLFRTKFGNLCSDFKKIGNYSLSRTKFGNFGQCEKSEFMKLLVHSYNVAIYSKNIANALGINKKELYDLCLGALLHDIGKQFIPDNILYKEETLTPKEFDLIKYHSYLGYIYAKSTNQLNCNVCNIILFHHETADGTGYPFGLKNDFLLTRIVHLADVYDALCQKRCYKEAFSKKEASLYIAKNSNLF